MKTMPSNWVISASPEHSPPKKSHSHKPTSGHPTTCPPKLSPPCLTPKPPISGHWGVFSKNSCPIPLPSPQKLKCTYSKKSKRALSLLSHGIVSLVPDYTVARSRKLSGRV